MEAPEEATTGILKANILHMSALQRIVSFAPSIYPYPAPFCQLLHQLWHWQADLFLLRPSQPLPVRPNSTLFSVTLII